jgi:hypothetical protein
MPTLFDPIAIGDLRLPNRIFMAPLTRNRSSGRGRVPNALMRDYYVQRASAGLIVSEATSVTPLGVGYPHTPGVWSQEQVAGWRLIADGVHQAGGRIFLQLWHVGRISDPSYHDGALPVAPSAIAPKGHVSLLRPERPYAVPRALETDEIPGVVEAFRKAPRTPWPQASTASKSMAPTAICSINSSRTPATNARIATAARSRTAPA